MNITQTVLKARKAYLSSPLADDPASVDDLEVVVQPVARAVRAVARDARLVGDDGATLEDACGVVNTFESREATPERHGGSQ